MYLDSVLDSFYLLSSLLAAVPTRQTCASTELPIARETDALPISWPLDAVTAFVDVSVVPMDTDRVLVHQTVLAGSQRE